MTDLKVGKRKPILPALLCAFLALLIVSAGCSNKKLNTQVTQFDSSVNTGATAIAAYYEGLNEQERTIYLEFLAFNPQFAAGNKLVLPELDAAGNPTGGQVELNSPLAKPTFSPKQIAARVAALKELAAYSKNLAALAGSDSPANFQSNVSTLKERLTSLKDTFQKLKDDQAAPDTKAGKFIDPLTNLIGVVGKWYLDERRWSAVSKAVIEADPYVNAVLDGVAADLDDYVNPVIITGAAERYAQAVRYYNKNRATLTLEQRTAALKRASDYKIAYDAASSTKPSIVPQRMKKAHQALVTVAKEGRSPKNLSELTAELELLKDDIDTLVAAVRQIAGEEGKAR